MLPPSLVREYRTVLDGCTARLFGHPPISMPDELRGLADEAAGCAHRDNYGTGELVEALESEVAGLLGKPAALFLPSGTMAQPIALRIWSEIKRTRYVGMHATSHLELHEHKGYQALHGLHGVLLGSPERVPTLADLQKTTDPLAAIVLELPMREIGGQLPEWDELAAQSVWAREHDVALHMDGARLWQCPSYYGKTLAEIAALFDSVYVSFYKDLGALPGAALAGPQWFVDAARTWVRRSGGNLYTLYPNILSARRSLRTHLPTIAQAAEAAQWVAAFFDGHAGFETVPRRPLTNMFHLRVAAREEPLIRASMAWSRESKVAALPLPRGGGAGRAVFEYTMGRGVLAEPKETWLLHLERYVEAVGEALDAAGRADVS